MAKNTEEVKKKAPKKEKKAKQKKKKETTPGYLKQVRGELKKVSFPSFKEIMKYTIATIVFCGLLVIFFLILNLVLSGVKGMF